MRVSGTKTFPISPLKTYELLVNPDVIVRAMPGLKSLNQVSDSLYEADIEIGVAGIKGRYQGSIEMKDIVAPEKYTLVVKGEGPMGFMEADVGLHLTAAEGDPDATVLNYDGEAKVGGTVAGVGQRVLSGVAKLLINQFFSGVEREAKAQV